MATSKIVGKTEKSNGFFVEAATNNTMTASTMLKVNNASNNQLGNGKITIASTAKSKTGMAV
ncbi:hypothetical protein CZ797_17060 [Pseudoalteromonas sp. JB197]|nr:hypothetical protein CZ797_17060 [Pseudoalteromonas sp. JB197]